MYLVEDEQTLSRERNPPAGVCVCVCAAASVCVWVAVSGRRPLQEGREGGADGATSERLLHAEVVHHALLDLLFSGGEQKAPEHCQLETHTNEMPRIRGVSVSAADKDQLTCQVFGL